ncbi:MAG TPA: hypothetical protein DD835_13990, partial [Halomonas sp.]|nr:hypothetical protein [Halomonas sp.]
GWLPLGWAALQPLRVAVVVAVVAEAAPRQSLLLPSLSRLHLWSLSHPLQSHLRPSLRLL